MRDVGTRFASSVLASGRLLRRCRRCRKTRGLLLAGFSDATNASVPRSPARRFTSKAAFTSNAVLKANKLDFGEHLLRALHRRAQSPAKCSPPLPNHRANWQHPGTMPGCMGTGCTATHGKFRPTAPMATDKTGPQLLPRAMTKRTNPQPLPPAIGQQDVLELSESFTIGHERAAAQLRASILDCNSAGSTGLVM